MRVRPEDGAAIHGQMDGACVDEDLAGNGMHVDYRAMEGSALPSG